MRSPLTSPPHRLAAPAVGLVLLAACVGCEIADPALPSFSTRLAVPVGSHDLTALELIEDQDFLSAGVDSVLCFGVEGDTADIELELDFSVDIEALSTDAEIGAVTLDELDPLTYDFVLSDVWPGAEFLPPGTWPVPAFDFDLESDSEGLDDFESADLASGRLVLALDNGLPIPLSGPLPPETVTVEVVDPGDGAVLAALVFDEEIPPGGSAEAEADLAGITLPGDLQVRVRGGSPGSPGAIIDPSASLGVALTLLDLTASSARAAFGPQSFEQTGSMALPDSLRIVEAEVATGLIDVQLSSGLPVGATVYLNFTELRRPTGDPFVMTFTLPVHGVEQSEADLAGAVITAGQGAALDSLTYTVGVVSDGSDGEIVEILAGARVTADMAPTTLALGEVTGYIPERSFAIEPLTETLDLPDELDGVQLSAASLTVDLFNGTGVAGELDLFLTASSASGETASVSTTATIAPARSEGLVRTTIFLDENNSDIVDLLSLPPETFTFSGEVRVGGEDEIGTVSPDDVCLVVWRADAPLRLTLESSQIDRNPEALDLDEDLREQLDEHLLSAEILVEIDNHFPFDLQVEFLVGPDSTSALDDPELVVGPVTVAAGAIGEISRYVETSVVTTQVIALDAAEIRAFTRPGAYTAMRALIPGTGGQEVLLRSVDGLGARGALTVEIMVEDDR